MIIDQKKKRIIPIIVSILVVLTMLPSVAFGSNSLGKMAEQPVPSVKAQPQEGYVTDENGVMSYAIRGFRVDLLGRVDDKWVGAFYDNKGLFPTVRIGEDYYNTFQDQTQMTKLMEEKGLKVEPVPTFSKDGKAVYVSYTITNTSQEQVVFDFAIAGDSMLSLSDTDTLEMMANGNGFTVKGGPAETDLKLSFFVKGNDGFRDADTMWLGTFLGLANGENYFANGQDKVENADSGVAVSWSGTTLEPGQSVNLGCGVSINQVNSKDALPVVAPVEPTPVDPTPEEPALVDPTPAEPTPAEPTLAEPSTGEPTKAEPSILYQILSWTGRDFVKNQTKEMVIRCDGPFSEYMSVEIDGKVLDKSLVKVSEGSTIVAIDVAYLNALSTGSHNLTINFTAGAKAEGTFTVSDAGKTGQVTKTPKTGDAETGMIALGLILLSGAAVVALNNKRVKN